MDGDVAAGGGVRFSVNLPQSGRLASASALIDVAQAAEELGFDTVSVRDHIVFDGSYVSTGLADVGPVRDNRLMFEALETLTFVASCTRRIGLGTSVLILPNRHPLLLAKQTATLDYLSGGRLRLGLGVGPNRIATVEETTILGTHRDSLVKEYDSFGIQGPRGPRMEEYFRALIVLWTEESPSFHGRYVSFEDAIAFPKPIQRPYPPIFVGGISAAARRRAARWDAGWIPSQATVDDIRFGVEEIRERRRSYGLDPEPPVVGINVHSVLADSIDAAVELAAPTLSHHFDGRQAFLDQTISGDLDTWVDRICSYRDAGVNYVELKPAVPSVDAFIQQLCHVRDTIMPAVSAASSAPSSTSMS